MDKDNQNGIIKFAEENHIQLVIEYVAESIQGLSNAILLKDNEVMETTE